MEWTVKRYILETFWERYKSGGKREKSEILDELCRKFSCHRKHETRLMRRSRTAAQGPRKRGRKSK